VHTFKGDFAHMDSFALQNGYMNLRTRLLDVFKFREDPSMDDVDDIMSGADPDKILEDDMNTISEVLGSGYFDHSEMITLPKSKLLDIEERIQAGTGPLDRAPSSSS
jgi:hypothetical protein